MGSCCIDNRGPIKEMVFVDGEQYKMLKEKIYKIFRHNPFYNYGIRRQFELERQFTCTYLKINETQKNSYLQFFLSSQNKLCTIYEQNIINFCKNKINRNLIPFFDNPDLLFFNILLFILCNTKNNLEKKQEIILEIINSSFYLNKNESKIDYVQLKLKVKNLIKITLDTFLCIIMLQVVEIKENIEQILGPEGNFKLLDNYEECELNDYIFYQINKILNQNYTYSNYLNLWEDYLLSPIIFAGYSDDKNISNYNKKLKDEIIKRTLNIFDHEIIINSILKLKLENEHSINEKIYTKIVK